MNIWYALFYLVGLVAATVSSAETISQSLQILEPITLTALIASLLVPFAGFDRSERWQKFVLQYGIVPLFGMYTSVLWRQSSAVGLLLFVCASAVHFGYWMSSIHSREYRLRQFQLGFAFGLPKTSALIASLNIRGLPNEADAIIKALLQGQPVVLKQVHGLLAGKDQSRDTVLVQEVEQELKLFR